MSPSLVSSGEIELTIPRSKNRKSRTAKLELRFTEVVLNQPYRKTHLPLLKVWIVNIKEVDPPKGVKPLEWMLLTTMEVKTFKQALEKVQWYCRRWGIEVYHRTIKSGCKIEERQLGDASSLKSCLAVDTVTQVMTIDKSDLKGRIGHLSPIRLNEIINGLHLVTEPREI